MQFKKLLILAGILAASTGAVAQQTTIEGTLTDDRYNYWIVGDGGTRDRVPVFAFEQAPTPAPQFFFNYYDSQMVMKWDVDPGALNLATINVVSAKLEVWNIKGAEWDPSAGEIHLFNTGYGPTYTEATWNESAAYVGPTSSTDADRDPHLLDLSDDSRAEDNASATPWAVGVPDAAYTGDPINDADEAFKITFTLDVSDPKIEDKIKQDLANGVASWVVVSTYAAAQPPAVAFYPELITKEGVGNATYGTAQAAPKLTLVVEETTSFVDWELYQ